MLFKTSVDSDPDGLDSDSLVSDLLELDPEVPDSCVFSEFVEETVYVLLEISPPHLMHSPEVDEE